jgi:hypothetical protein
MPRIPPQVLYSTFYLYPSVEHAENGANFGGTGFFVAYPTGQPSTPNLMYAVTNWHVAVRDGASVMRVNKKGGGFDVLEFDPSEWEFVPKGPDIAILTHVQLAIRESVHEVVGLEIGLFLNTNDLAILGIGPGDDIFMIGRFIDHEGTASNVPAARFGNISTMPQIVPQPTGADDIPSFILDIHSRTGYSGSPVFVYRTHGSDLTRSDLITGPLTHFIKLLGVHWGQFPEQWEIESGKKAKVEGVSVSDDARYIKGMSGMTLAIPAWKLWEFLDRPKFKDQRNKDLAEIMHR